MALAVGEGGQVADVGAHALPMAHGAEVDVRAITKRFGAVVAVEAVSFTVKP